ncbi:MAG: helix-turn-helix transcriptional regulator [Bauldia sp.]
MTFIGREMERAVIEAAIRDLDVGRGGLLLVTGEAGIGKSALLQLAGEKAAAAGLRAVWGRCSEEPGAPLFWPWLQLLRAWLRGRHPLSHPGISPESAAAVDRLLSPQTIPRSLPGATEPEDAEQSRFLFMQGIADFWREAAAMRPLMLLIDDLHRDNSASLKLLAAMTEAALVAPILIIAAYRREEAESDGALRTTLGTVLGRSNVQQLTLSNLSPSESERLLSALTGGDAPPSLGRAVATRSEGNPLFLRELARELAKNGSSSSAPGSPSTPRLPDSIRILFGQRLRRLAGPAGQVLAIAATIGRRFDQEMLSGIAFGLGALAVPPSLEELLQSRLVVETDEPGHYQFVHELLRETVYAAISSTRRMAYHRAVAEWIENHHGSSLEHHVARLAYHYAQAAMTGVAEKAVEYHARAARQAEKMHFHEEAAAYFREAVRLDLAAGGRNSSDLLPALGEMEVLAGKAEVAEMTFQGALQTARSSGDGLFFARSVLGLEYATWRIGRDERQIIPLLNEALTSEGALPPRTVIELYSALCRANALAGESAAAMTAYRRAVAEARGLGNAEALFQALRALVATRFWPELLHARIEASREGLAIAQAEGHLDWAVSGTMVFLFLDLIEAGQMDDARRVAELHREGARAAGDRFAQLVSEHLGIMLAMLERADAVLEDQIAAAFHMGLRWGPSANAAGVHGTQMFTLRRLQGRLGELRPVLQQYLAQNDSSATWAPALALVYAELGMLPEARSVFERLARRGFEGIARDARWGITVVYLAEVCVTLGAVSDAPKLYDLLLPYAGRNITTTTVCLGPADRYLGLLSAAGGDINSAVLHLAVAREFADKCSQPIWRALVETDLASIRIARRGPDDEIVAKALLRSALATGKELNVPAIRNRCLAVRAKLIGDAKRPKYPDGLTSAEIKVLRLMAAGATNKSIGRDLAVSPHTVAAHVRSILGKTGTANRTGAADYARRKGLVGGEEVFHDV